MLPVRGYKNCFGGNGNEETSVTTDVPGCRDTVINGYNGFLSELGDIKV